MTFSKKLMIVAILASALFSTVNVSAMGPMDKLGRGIANICFSWAELPIKVYDTNQEDGGIAAITTGVIKGVYYTAARIIVGATEVVTFWMPLPGAAGDGDLGGWGYGPTMKPAYVIDTEHNLFNIVYRDTAIMN